MQKTNPDAWLSKRVGTMLAYADLVGVQPSLQDVRDKLRPLNRTNVVEHLAWINALTNSWQLVENSDDDRRVRAYVLPNWQARIENWCKNNNNNEVWIFPRFTVLWLMRQAFVACSPEGERIDTREKLERLGEACLMANNVAPFPNQPERLTTSLEIAANTVPNIDYFSREEYNFDIARMHRILVLNCVN